MHRVILKEHIASVQLCKDAPEGPHVNLIVVFASENNFWSSITSTLDIAAQVIMDETTGTKVNDLDLTLAVTFDQDVLWFEITMD